MKLNDWAKQVGLSYRGAYRQFHAGQIPGAYQLPTGTIIVPDLKPEQKSKPETEYTIKIVLDGADIDDKSLKEFERFAKLYFALAKKRRNKKETVKVETDNKNRTVKGMGVPYPKARGK